MNKMFFDMFGPLEKKALSDDEMIMTQKLHPQTFGGYPSTMLLEHANNKRLYENPHQLGYEGLLNKPASVFSPGDPKAFGQWFQQNMRNMNPYQLKKVFDYMQWLNNADDLQKNTPRDRTK